MDVNLALEESQPGLAEHLAVAIRKENLCTRTVRTYQHWISQYLAYFDLKNPSRLSGGNAKEFLNHLVRRMSLSRAKLNQAREALVFLYEKVLDQPLVARELAPIQSK